MKFTLTSVILLGISTNIVSAASNANDLTDRLYTGPLTTIVEGITHKVGGKLVTRNQERYIRIVEDNKKNKYMEVWSTQSAYNAYKSLCDNDGKFIGDMEQLKTVAAEKFLKCGTNVQGARRQVVSLNVTNVDGKKNQRKFKSAIILNCSKKQWKLMFTGENTAEEWRKQFIGVKEHAKIEAKLLSKPELSKKQYTPPTKEQIRTETMYREFLSKKSNQTCADCGSVFYKDNLDTKQPLITRVNILMLEGMEGKKALEVATKQLKDEQAQKTEMLHDVELLEGNGWLALPNDPRDPTGNTFMAVVVCTACMGAHRNMHNRCRSNDLDLSYSEKWAGAQAESAIKTTDNDVVNKLFDFSEKTLGAVKDVLKDLSKQTTMNAAKMGQGTCEPARYAFVQLKYKYKKLNPKYVENLNGLLKETGNESLPASYIEARLHTTKSSLQKTEPEIIVVRNIMDTYPPCAPKKDADATNKIITSIPKPTKLQSALLSKTSRRLLTNRKYCDSPVLTGLVDTIRRAM